MRTALIAAALAVLAALGGWAYHTHTVNTLNDQLQAEIGRHAVTAARLTACQSASRAECAVARAQSGTADAREALADLIKERKK